MDDGSWKDGTWSATFWLDNVWEGEPNIPSQGETSAPSGVTIDEFGAVHVVFVSRAFTGAAGDVIIEGTRCTQNGAMYVTLDTP